MEFFLIIEVFLPVIFDTFPLKDIKQQLDIILECSWLENLSFVLPLRDHPFESTEREATVEDTSLEFRFGSTDNVVKCSISLGIVGVLCIDYVQ